MAAEAGKIEFVVARYHTHTHTHTRDNSRHDLFRTHRSSQPSSFVCAACPTIELTRRRGCISGRATGCVRVHDTIRHAPLNRPKDPSDKLASPGILRR
jgi:hypothetical protein